MEHKLPEEVKQILEKVSAEGFQIYIVGGAVRDLLMGRPVKDWDFTTDAKPEDILKLFPDGFYNNKFGTVGIPVHGSEFMDHSKENGSKGLLSQSASMNHEPPASINERTNNQLFEITTMRKEGLYEDVRHPSEITWTNKVEEDLARRDFTINAIALGFAPVIPRVEASTRGNLPNTEDCRVTRRLIPRNDNKDLALVDPYHGQQDIENKLLRAVGNPNLRFKEDALRLMRAIRIATELEFEIEEKTFLAIKANAHLINEVSQERIRDELLKILTSSNGYMGILKLREAGILQVILPELEATFGIMQEGPKHDRVYDIGEHSLLTLKETPSQNPLVKLAALLHDIGKTDTTKVSEDGNVTFYNHDVVGGKLALSIAYRLHLSKKQTDKLYRLIRWHLFSVDEHQTDAAIRRFIKKVGLDNIEDMMALRIGDRLGGGTQKAVSWRMEKFSERIHQVLQKPFSISDLKVNGQDVMGILNIPPGRKVGEILNKLFEEVLEDASKNKREYLLEKIKNPE